MTAAIVSEKLNLSLDDANKVATYPEGKLAILALASLQTHSFSFMYNMELGDQPGPEFLEAFGGIFLKEVSHIYQEEIEYLETWAPEELDNFCFEDHPHSKTCFGRMASKYYATEILNDFTEDLF